MAKYSKYQRKTSEKKGSNPLWRGIGCILIVIVPLTAYVLMLFCVPPLIATGKIPHQLLGYVQFPLWVFKYQAINGMATFIGSIHNLWMKMLTWFVILLLLTAVASLLYSMIYSLVGPARYTELDALPSKYKSKKYTR